MFTNTWAAIHWPEKRPRDLYERVEEVAHDFDAPRLGEELFWREGTDE